VRKASPSPSIPTARRSTSSGAEVNTASYAEETESAGRGSAGRQTQYPPPAGPPASSPPSRHGRNISGDRLLRSPRFAASQIRDAAARRGRTDPSQSRGQGSRAIPALVLSSPDSPPTRWSGGIDSAKTRPARSPQVDGARIGLPRAATRRSTPLEVFRAGAAAPGKIRRADSSTHHRAHVIQTSKKNAAERWRFARTAGGGRTAGAL